MTKPSQSGADLSGLYRCLRWARQKMQAGASPYGLCLALPRKTRLVPKWLQSRCRGTDAAIQPMPRFVFGSIDHIQALVRPHFTVFEYGAGGSTLWYAARAASVIAIEHQECWWQRLRAEIERRHILNCRLKLIAPNLRASADPGVSESDPRQYVSHWTHYQNVHFRDYVNSIGEQPDNSLHLVSVDGRARPACVLHAIPKVRPGGLLVLDDAERASYREAKLLLADWACREFSGLAPQGGSVIKTTSVYTKPERC